MPPSQTADSSIRSARKQAVLGGPFGRQIEKDGETASSDNGVWIPLPKVTEETSFTITVSVVAKPVSEQKSRALSTARGSSPKSPTIITKPVLAELKANQTNCEPAVPSLSRWRTASFRTPDKTTYPEYKPPSWSPPIRALSPTESEESNSCASDYQLSPKGTTRVRRCDITPQHERWVKRCQNRGYRWEPTTVWMKHKVDKQTGEYVTE